MNLKQIQSSFKEMLLDSGSEYSESLKEQLQASAIPIIEGKQSNEADLLLTIYRNNVIYSLTQALQSQYPVVFKLVGESFFLALARDYVRLFPPQEPALFFYGKEFPEFIAQHQHCQTLPYLADVALLEWQIQTSMNSADEPFLNTAQLSTIAPNLLGDIILSLQCSVILFSSPYPVVLIREQQKKELNQLIDLDKHNGSFAVIVRQDYEVKVVNLEIETFHLLEAFDQDKSMNQAWTATQEKYGISDEQLSSSFQYLLGLGVFKQLD